MVDIQLTKTDLHAELFQVVSPPKDPKERTKVATRLRAAAKREGSNVTVAQRLEAIYVATSKAAENALPAGAGRGRKGLSLTKLIEDAK